MADPFSDLIDAFRTVMASAWPDVVPNNILEAEEALTMSYEQNMVLPYAIIDLPGLSVSDRDGITNRAWRSPFRLYYISEVEDDSALLRAKMQTLADALEAPLSAGQIIPPNVGMACGRDLEPNALLIMLNATQRAAQVSGTVAIGLTRTP